jgi:hypothetical protein
VVVGHIEGAVGHVEGQSLDIGKREHEGCQDHQSLAVKLKERLCLERGTEDRDHCLRNTKDSEILQIGQQGKNTDKLHHRLPIAHVVRAFGN